ncbi:Eco57I restriction-modification methylase domain-containing protein [Treponema putidum]|uniref:Eco57I restriction-modification methylase domain-containing protein n=1 Tax=Treponema putidum TaxID=221027 RepID=UPI0021082265|nr:N-6 DNA methylase [Treponema putidum]UTY31223.1 DNA modification methylase [Treponema putidum]
MTDFRTIFEQTYPGKDKIYEDIILPIFKNATDLRKATPIALAEADKKNVLQASIIAQVAGTFPVTFADVEVQSSVHLKRNRVSIQNCIRKIMEDNSSALIFFHFADNQNEWRVSFAHRAETLQTSTSAKRYTYLCGIEHPCRTIAERFQYLAKKADSAAITVEDMLNAFSVEALSKEFFAEYKVFYEDFVQYITGKRYIKAKGKSGYENRAVAGAKVHTKIFAHFQRIGNGDEQKAEKKVRDYIKKMMGRLVFIQFLQKKGWLGCTDDNWNDGDRDYLQHLFERSSEKQQNDFLSTVLDPLFFGMLNTNPEDRARHFKQKGWDKTLLDRFGKIPYLNGGLFEEDPEDSVPVIFPAVLFGNPKQREIERIFRSGQNNDYPYDASCGLLDFFARYNFTIDETDPEDREVGVDPEMLGKIFENLLEDNKDKGAFYTPKEIVQYMCRESLIAYLAEETQDEPAMRDLVLKHETARIKDKNAALSALKTVKICDPAVGSGAFPMGMLNELFACRMLLEGDSSDEENRSRIKKDIVRENIYGVDIEKGAVDIARLRFWLAIIVDEKIPLPLPNLDYKIMQGNSLLESYEGISLENLLHRNKNNLFDNTEESIKALQTAIIDYYQPKTHKSKQAMKQQISQLVYTLLSEQGRSKEHDKLADLKKISIDANNQFFLWHTWFSEVFNRPSKQGFDIVIGNPPYGAKTSNTDKENYKRYYEASQTARGLKGSTDTFAVFVNLGYNILCKNGNLAFIIPMAITSSDAMMALHNLLENNCETIKVSSYSNRPKQIFDAACIRTSVFFFTKTLTANRHIYTTKLQRRRYTDSIKDIIDKLQFIDSKELKLPGRYAKISNDSEKKILQKCFSSNKNIKSFTDVKGVPFYYRVSGGRYFNVVSDIPTGSTQDKTYCVISDYSKIIVAILSTNLFWFYQQVYTDGLHIKLTELEMFPLPDLEKVSRETISQINNKYFKYKTDIEKNKINRDFYFEYKIRKSKKLIDELDDLVCPLYGLTKAEVAYIKNYELEFRLDDE